MTQNSQKEAQIPSGGTATEPRDPVTARILKAFFDTYNAHGWGFFEAVYKRALMVELRHLGATVAEELRTPIYHRGVKVGDYYADLVVDDVVIVECKVAERIIPAHRAQVLNYLKATPYEVGLILNFGEKPTFERLILSNGRKGGRRA